MKSLDALTAPEALALRGLVFDLDDTLLDHGALSEEAYGALFRLRASGLRLIACTGRPAGWGEILQRQWPVNATVVENGAIALVSENEGVGHARRVHVVDRLDRQARKDRRKGLLLLAHELLMRFPSAALADDNDARLTDVTLDIGEHRSVPADEIAEIRRIAGERGVRTLLSSVHLHLTHEPDDKASGVIRLLGERYEEDATLARARYAFVGDSGNDAAPFAAFRLTFGVANVRAHLRALSVPPRFVAAEPMGQGFAAIAARLVTLRTS